MLKKYYDLERRLIHPEIAADPKEFRRARLLLACCVVSGVACVGLIGVGLTLRPNEIASHSIVLAGHLIVTASATTLPFFKTMRVPAATLNITAIFQILSATYWTGGTQSPVLLALPIAPLLMGIIGSPLLTSLCTTTALIGIGSFFAMDAYGYAFPNVGQPLVTVYGTLLWATLTGVGILFFAERQYDALYDRIENELKERKQAQSALETSVHQIQELSAAKDWYVAYVSHELRNSLAGVMASIELFDHYPNSKSNGEYVQLIHKSGNRLKLLLDDLLEFSTLEQGQLQLRSARFNIQELAEEVHREALNTAEAKRIKVRCAPSQEADLFVNSDQQRVRQILTNLVSNGVKYTDSGEVVISIRTDEQKTRAIIEVSDTGPGVPKNQQEHIFEPYTRLSTHNSNGTGLGLAISKRLANLLGTDLQMSSELGEGSTFSFELPLLPP